MEQDLDNSLMKLKVEGDKPAGTSHTHCIGYALTLRTSASSAGNSDIPPGTHVCSFTTSFPSFLSSGASAGFVCLFVF